MVHVKRNESPVLRIGIAGLGIAGSSIIPSFLKHPFVKLSAAATRDQNRREKFARDFEAETFQSIEELCQSPAVDAIYIATPTELHTEHVLIAANNKKHIIVEKPMAFTLEDADKMIAAAEKNGVVMVVGHSHSFEPPIRKIREIIRSGELGDVRMIHNWYFNDWIYRPRTPEELDTQLGGGVTFRQGSHQFDIIRLIGGGLIKSVRAMTGVWDPTRPTEGSHTVFLDFENGAAATAVYNGYDHFHSTELTYGISEGGPVVTTDVYAGSRRTIDQVGSIEESKLKSLAGYSGSRAKTYDHEEQQHPFFGLTVVSCEKGDIRQSPDGLYVYGEDKRYEVSLPTENTGRDAVIAELYEAVYNDYPPVHDGRWAKANLEVCLAVLESSKQRKEIYLNYQTAVLD